MLQLLGDCGVGGSCAGWRGCGCAMPKRMHANLHMAVASQTKAVGLASGMIYIKRTAAPGWLEQAAGAGPVNRAPAGTTP